MALQEFLSEFASTGILNSSLVFSLCSVILLGRWEPRPAVIARRVRDTVALLALDAVLDYAVFRLQGTLLWGGAAWMLLAIIPTAAYAALVSSFSWQGRVVRCTTFSAVFVILDWLVASIGPAFGDLYFALGGSPNLVVGILCIVAALLLLRLSTEELPYVPSSYVVLVAATDLVAIGMGSFFMDVVVSQGADAAMAGVAIVVGAAFLALVSIAYVMYYFLAREHSEAVSSAVLRKAQTDDAGMLEVARDTYESLREARHEIKNHDAYMKALLDAGEYDQLRAYFNRYQLQNKGLLGYVQTGNRVMDAVVNAEISKGRANGVEIKTMLAVPPSAGFAGEDAYSLIANLLDNAIEGTVASGAKSDDRVARLSVMPHGSYFVVTVTNPVDPEKMPDGAYSELATTKGDREMHGWGTKVIGRIARKYDGTASFKVENAIFTATVMLAVPEGAVAR